MSYAAAAVPPGWILGAFSKYIVYDGKILFGLKSIGMPYFMLGVIQQLRGQEGGGGPLNVHVDQNLAISDRKYFILVQKRNKITLDWIELN